MKTMLIIWLVTLIIKVVVHAGCLTWVDDFPLTVEHSAGSFVLSLICDMVLIFCIYLTIWG